jgi:hypothetical protein
MEYGRLWTGAEPMALRELDSASTGLGSSGDPEARLAAVVALLASGGSDNCAEGGAFAADPIMTASLTHGFHNCLREPPVNSGEQRTDTNSPRKQC